MPDRQVKTGPRFAQLNHKTKTLVSLNAGRSDIAFHNLHLSGETKNCVKNTVATNTFTVRTEFEIPRGRRRNEHFVSDASRFMQRRNYRVPPATPSSPCVRGQGVTRTAQDQEHVRD